MSIVIRHWKISIENQAKEWKKQFPSSGTGKTLNLVSFIEMLEDDKVGLKGDNLIKSCV